MVKVIVIIALVLTGCATKPIETCESRTKLLYKDKIEAVTVKYIKEEMTTIQYHKIVDQLEEEEDIQLIECEDGDEICINYTLRITF